MLNKESCTMSKLCHRFLKQSTGMKKKFRSADEKQKRLKIPPGNSAGELNSRHTFFIIFACLKHCLRQVLFPTSGANPVVSPRVISLAIHLKSDYGSRALMGIVVIAYLNALKLLPLVF